MVDALKWLLAIEVIGLVACPLAFAAFPFLRDRGYGFAKPLGLIVIGFFVWILSYARILPNSGWAYGLAVVVLAVGAGAYVWWKPGALRRSLAFLRREWRVVVAGEVLFLLFFVAWAVFRAYDPAISGTEKPMDFLFLNASVFAGHAPPEDPWLSGFPVAYYYFGYWMFGGLSQLSGVPTYVAYNLSLALIAGMSAGAIFTVVYCMVARDGGTRRSAIWWGVAGAVLLLVAANLAGVWEFLANLGAGSEGFYEWLSIDGIEPAAAPDGWRPDTHWWWFRASRVINTFDAGGASLDYTINEFPFFSLMLGDLHPHVMSIPFVLAGVGAALSLALSPARFGLVWLRRNPVPAAVLALLLGASGFINAWDLFFLGALVFGVATVKVYFQRRASGDQAGLRHPRRLGLRNALASRVAAVRVHVQQGKSLCAAALGAAPPVVILAAAGLALFSPFYFGTLSSQVRLPPILQWPPFAGWPPIGEWSPIGPAAYASRPIHFVTVWGFALLVTAPFLVTAAWRSLRPQCAWLRREWAEIPHRRGEMKPARSIFVVVVLALAVPYFIWAGAHLEIRESATAGDMFTRFLSVLPLGVATAALFIAAFARARRALWDAGSFGLLVAALAFYMLYGAELLFVHDLFGNRMNTIFKLHYQAWIVLAAVGAYGLHYWRSRHKRLRGVPLAASRVVAAAAVVLMAGALYYSIAAAVTKTAGSRDGPTLDGLAFVEATSGAERRAIDELRKVARPGESMIEAVGGDYSEFGRISASTGIPTVLGWPGHEHQWRGNTDLFLKPESPESPAVDREADVERIYRTEDVSEARSLLAEYDVTFVYVGRRERRQYLPVAMDKFDELGTRVFEEGDIVIFRVWQGDDD